MRNSGKLRSNQKIKTLLFIFVFIVNPLFRNFFIDNNLVLNNFFGKTISIDQTDIYYINQRRGYYENKFIGKIQENKLSVYVKKYLSNFFQGIDPNYYFFANHPRERAGITEKDKFSFIFLPFFILGLFFAIKERKYFSFIYFFSLLIFFSFFVNIDTNFILLYPAIVYFISNGLLATLDYLLIRR